VIKLLFKPIFKFTDTFLLVVKCTKFVLLAWNPKVQNNLPLAPVISHTIPTQKTKRHQNILFSSQSLNITYKTVPVHTIKVYMERRGTPPFILNLSNRWSLGVVNLMSCCLTPKERTHSI